MDSSAPSIPRSATRAFMGFPALLWLCWGGPLPLCAETEDVPAFRTGVLPILTKNHCNSGGCHGAATGQGGFRLSLLGYDPEADYLSITRELRGRRLTPERPEESLLLRKPTRELEHEGGRRLPKGSDGYQVLLQWIEAGSPYGPSDLQVASIQVEPPDSRVGPESSPIALRVFALLSDGSRQEVTSLALYDSNDTGVAEVSRDGRVRVLGPGRTTVMVRYGGQVTSARFTLPYTTDTAEIEPPFAPRNFVDTWIQESWQRLGLTPASSASDRVLLRRLFLDLTGRVPEVEELVRWLPDLDQGVDAAMERPISEELRDLWIDRLLAEDAFVDLWTLHLADWLLARERRGQPAAFKKYTSWLRKQIQENRPLNDMVAELLTSKGSPLEVGPANFYHLAADPRDLVEHVGRMFLGIQLGCARCHAHPTDRWTQEEYHQLAAFFGGVEATPDRVQLHSRATVHHPKTGLPVEARLPSLPEFPAPKGVRADDLREPFTEWLLDPNNPLFARNVVNRVWKILMGDGLVEPVDDLRPTNPPSHPELLDALARDFVENGYDLRQLIRTVVQSRTYQLGTVPSESAGNGTPFFVQARPKPMKAQVFLDLLSQVTGVPENFPDQPEGTRAVEWLSVSEPHPTLDVLGRCDRATACETGSLGGGMAMALHLINGSILDHKLRHSPWTTAPGKPGETVDPITHLFLKALTRYPTDEEYNEWSRLLSAMNPQETVLQDLLWVLLNSREFAFIR